MKSFYSCLDFGSVKEVPQRIQHLVIADTAKKLGGKVTYYTSEDPLTLASQTVVTSLVKDCKNDIDGVIFYSLKSFQYSGQLNIKLLKFILEQNCEVHFAREEISISNLVALKEIFPMLYTTDYLSRNENILVK